MFAGIVEELAVIDQILQADTDSLRPHTLRIKSALNHTYTKVGDSISVNGVCLTAVRVENKILDFELSPETLQRTNLTLLVPGSKVNLERSLIVGDRVHGHFVFGHVDTVIKLQKITELGASKDLEFNLPAELKKYIVVKGSASINGVSLTVSAVTSNSFTVSLIPHTLSVTGLGIMEVGDKANLEIDMLARYVMEKST